MIFAMVVPNIIGVLFLTPVVKKELNRYLKAIKVKKDAIDDGADDLQKEM